MVLCKVMILKFIRLTLGQQCPSPFKTEVLIHNRKNFDLKIICLALFLVREIAFLSFIIEQAICQTICLLIIVSLSGLLLIQRLQNQLGGPHLQLLKPLHNSLSGISK